MSLLSIHGKAASPMQELISDLRATMAEQGTAFATPDHTRRVLSMESLHDAELGELVGHYTELSDTIKASFEGLAEKTQIGTESLSDVQIEAGSMVALAAGNPAAYAEAAMKNQATGGNGVNLVDAEVSGVAGTLDYRTEASLEAFDEKELAEMLPYSIAFNVQASRQDEFSETFYPTTVVSPEVGGIDMTINRTLVFNQVHHNTSGKPTDFDRKPLVEAAINANILADESTSLIPHYLADDSNADKFVDTALVSTSVRRVGNADVTTGALKIGKKVDLLGISQHPALLGAGIIDHTDAVDSRINLEQIYIQNGAEAAAIAFPTERLPRSGFIKTAEGGYREMGLQFTTRSLVLNKYTRAVDGSEPTSLQSIRDSDYTVRLTVNVDGRLNTETGETHIYASPVEVAQVFDANGNELSLTSGAGKTLVDSLDLGVIGYDLKAARTNSNRRTRGLLLNTDIVAERFSIPLAAPLSAPSPTGSNRDARDLDSLITAARVRNSNNAVTSLLNYAESLRAYVTHGVVPANGVPELEGLGRFVVRPFFEEVTLDLSDVINSVSSKDRAEDISAVLVNGIRDVAYRMYRESGYQVALDASTVGSKDACLVVGTDAVIQRHLMVVGDPRTFGSGFKSHKIVTSWDSRVANKIILTFAREGMAGVPDALSFGTHAWIPELATSMQVTRDGAHYTEAMVQPRTRHVNNLPVMAIINVVGLEDVLSSSVAVPTKDVT